MACKAKDACITYKLCRYLNGVINYDYLQVVSPYTLKSRYRTQEKQEHRLLSNARQLRASLTKKYMLKGGINLCIYPI